MIGRRRGGLGSLIPGAEFDTPAGTQEVPVTAIAVNPYQPRREFDPEALDELTESIRRHGVLQPLVVRHRDGGFELIAGERRLQASRKAGLAHVPVIVRECTDEQMLALALVENLQREDLNAMEAARSYKQLMDEFGLGQTEVAEAIGKSRSAVANTLRLLALPMPIQQAVESGVISEGHGRALLAATHPERQQALFDLVVAKGLSVRELEALVNPEPKATARRKEKTPKGAVDAQLKQIENDLQSALSSKVRFRPDATLGRGVIEIEYYTEDDLQRIYEAIVQK